MEGILRTVKHESITAVVVIMRWKFKNLFDITCFYMYKI